MSCDNTSAHYDGLKLALDKRIWGLTRALVALGQVTVRESHTLSAPDLTRARDFKGAHQCTWVQLSRLFYCRARKLLTLLRNYGGLLLASKADETTASQ